MNEQGFFTRQSFMEIRRAEQYYGSPRNYLYQINRLTDDSWTRDQMDEGTGTPVTIYNIEQADEKSVAQMLKNESGRYYNRSRLQDLDVCRLIDGNYPAYKSIMPKNNPNKMIINRAELLGAVRRVAVYSNQATSHVLLKIAGGELMISAEDTGYSISAYERLSCEYDGVSLEIGFKAPFLADILNNFSFENVCIEMADNCRPALIVSADGNNASEDLSALLMPVMI